MQDKKKKGGGGFCKFLLMILFSHFGLCLMVVLYCVLGGLIFEHLEKNNEIQICYDTMDEYLPMENKTVNKIVDVLTSYEGISDRTFMAAEVETIIRTYRTNSMEIGYDGTDCGAFGQDGGPPYQWEWAGAMYFSVTVVTTIGRKILE
ncbi:hypothetical protein FSP39_009627 [Pinctada imbricata]|uniref:Uncharacterized protein n=1 Tax=Pinctada imbricata TaxID=66713 RepID=A0AA88Y4G8_PINIB|nr:hypothetical protein FSP39_009627 [Pinctada imbricata]